MGVGRPGPPAGPGHRAALTAAADEPLPGPRRLAGAVGGAVAATLLGGAVGLGVLAATRPLHAPAGSHVPLAVSALTGAVLIGALLTAAVRGLAGAGRSWTRWSDALAWAALAAVAASSLALLLSGTRHYLFGVSGDQGFRVQYLTRYATTWRLEDMAYADLPPYYPAGWFWPGGRAAALLGVDGWAAYQPYAIATMAAAAALAAAAWAVVVDRPTAALLALVTTLVGLRLGAYEPYSWLVTVLLPPSAVLGWRALRDAAAGAPARRLAPSAVLLGLVLGVAGAVYTLLAVFLGVVLVLLAVGAALARPRGSAAVRGPAAVLAVAGLVALPPALLVWAPYLWAVLRDGWAAGSAQRYLPEVGAAFPLPMVELSPTGLLSAVGTAWLVLAWRRSTTARGLAVLVLAAYGWYALSTLALAAGTTLLPFRVEPTLVAALACAGALGGVDGVRALARRSTEPGRVAATAALLGGAVLLGVLQSVPATWEWSREASLTNPYPDGSAPGGEPDPGDRGRWTDDLHATVADLTGRAPQDLVVLTAHQELLTYYPYRTYQTPIPQYANPLADFAGRRERVDRWAAAGSADELLGLLDAAPDRPPTVFVLERRGPALRVGVTVDLFPRDPALAGRPAVFDEQVFASPAFVRRDVGPFAVVVRTG